MTDIFNVTNDQRAQWAMEAVEMFSYATNMVGEETEIIISDLLVNLHHLAVREKLNIDSLFARAKRNAQQEIYEECESARETLRRNGRDSKVPGQTDQAWTNARNLTRGP